MNNAMQYLQMVLSNRSMIENNPIAKNTVQMMNNGDYQGIESLARNLCKERGINPDEAIMKMRQSMRF